MDTTASEIVGQCASGEIRVLLSVARFDALAAGATLRIDIETGAAALRASFDLSGLETAFAKVDSSVPAVEQRSEPFLAGIEGVTNPILIESTKVTPYYPKKARYRWADGQVILQAIVHADGTVGPISVILVMPKESENLGFEEAAVEAVSQWRYKPGTIDGQSVDVYFSIVIDFSLHPPRKPPGFRFG